MKGENSQANTNFRLLLSSVALALLLISIHGYSQTPVPELWGQRVHDEAKVLSPITIDSLELKLKKYEDTTTNQIAILTLRSLKGEILEEYSIKVVEKWKLGTKKNDNGILLLVVVEDRTTRIEVGHGLEGVLTDLQTNHIIGNEMLPSFKRGDYDAGINAGVTAIMKTIAGEYKATTANKEFNAGERVLMGLMIFGVLGVFTFISLFTQGCGGWGLYVFLIPFYLVFPINIIGVNASTVLLGLYIIGMPIAKIILSKSAWGKNRIKKWQSSGGSSGGGWSMGSGWGGSGGGGGFSGGGGSFGGGGSSGSW